MRHYIIFWLTTQTLGDSIYFRRYAKSCKMYQVDLLYLILDVTLKICQHFLNIIRSRWHKKLSHIVSKDTNDFLHKLDALPSLSEDISFYIQ